MVTVLDLETLYRILQLNSEDDWYILIKNPSVNIELIDKNVEAMLLDTDSVLFKQMLSNNNGKTYKKFKNLEIKNKPNYILIHESFIDLKIGNFYINKNNLEYPFKLSYAKTLEKNSQFSIDTLKGWKAIFNQKSLTSNALIINDSYIFDDKENQTKVGSKNIIQLLDAILPNQLKVEYHILINTTTSKNKSNIFYDGFIPDLIEKITQLRSYKIIVEIIIGEGFHKRKLFTNFLNVTTDKGFKLFDTRDSIKVLDHNDITIETMFTRNDPNQGDSQYDEMKIRIKELRKLIKASLDWVNADTYNNTRSFYYSNSTQGSVIEIKNRLINNL